MVIIFCFFLLSLHFAFFPTCDSYKCYGVTLLRCYAFAECSEPWSVGKDVAVALGYKDTVNALKTHIDDEDKNTVVFRDGIQGDPNKSIINESGLYSLALSSKQPQAKGG